MPVQFSILIPTLNEAENLPLLVPRIATALAGSSYEIIVIDDNSRDNTVAVCNQLSQKFPLRLLVREHPQNGLSGAVLDGMAVAQGDYFVVMDADLQHPPERIPALLVPLQTGQADFTLGSRHIEGGTIEGRWGFLRRLNSWGAALLARPFSGKVTDPMSGFFALSRQTFQSGERLTPIGYKIALELMCKCRVNRVVEIPIHFGTRQMGESKLSLKEQLRYLQHLGRLYQFKYPWVMLALKIGLVAVAAGLIILSLTAG